MSELKNLSAILEGGAVPAGYNGKAIGKLSKTYLKLENRKVVNLYPIRTVMHEDSRYCLYACPLKGTEIDEAILQSIKAEVDTLEIGEIRYDSVQSCGYDYYIVLKSATKLFSVLLASKRPLITELADKLRLKYPLLPTISPCPTMRLEAIRSIIPISCRRYPKSV